MSHSKRSSAASGEFHPAALMPGTTRPQAGSSSTPTTPGFRFVRETTPPTSPNDGLLEDTQFANYNPYEKDAWTTEVPVLHHEPEDEEFINGWTPVSLKKKYWIPLVIFMLLLAIGMEVALTEAQKNNGWTIPSAYSDNIDSPFHYVLVSIPVARCAQWRLTCADPPACYNRDGTRRAMGVVRYRDKKDAAVS